MRACLAAPVVLGLHCGSGGAENPGASSDANYETIRAAEGFLDSNQAATPQEIATFLSGRPDVEIAEANADSSVYARFKNGRTLVVGGPRAPSSEPLPEMSSDPPPITDPVLDLAVKDLPKVGIVKLFDSLDGGYADTLPTLARQYAQLGYAIASDSVQRGTIEEWRALGNEGYFVVDAHGGSEKGRDGLEHQAVWTGSVASKELDLANAKDLDEGRLVYFAAKNNGKTETHYAVTDLFVSQIKFADRTVVFFNACSSGAIPMAKAVVNANANLFLGWTKPVDDKDAAFAAYYIADRTLGRFKLPPQVTGPKVPLTWNELYADMPVTINPATGVPYTKSKAVGAELAFYGGPGDGASIPPIVSTGSINSTTKEFTLIGVFGPTPSTLIENPNNDGTGGTPVTVKSWAFDRIEGVGITAKSTIMVKVGERRSNIFRFPGGTYTLMGGTAIDVPFRVRERMVISLNNQKILEDPIDRVDGPHPAFSFEAMTGDTLKIEVFSNGLYGGLGPLALQTPFKRAATLVGIATVDLMPSNTTRIAFSREWQLRNYVFSTK